MKTKSSPNEFTTAVSLLDVTNVYSQYLDSTDLLLPFHPATLSIQRLSSFDDSVLSQLYHRRLQIGELCIVTYTPRIFISFT